MLSIEELSKKVEDLENRINALEGKKVSSTNTSKKISINKAKSLSDHILDLKESGFFKTSKTAEETFAELSKIYSCEKARVVTELIRISDKKQLRILWKEVKDKKMKGYVW